MSEANTEGRLTAEATAGTLRPFIDAAYGLVDEGKWRFDGGELSVRAVDPANVGMLTAELGADAFGTFDAESGVIGVNYSRLADIVTPGDRAGYETPPKTPVTFEQTEYRKMLVTVGAFEYDLALIDPDSIRKEPDLPNLDLPAAVSVTAVAFREAVHRADALSSHVVLGFDTDDGTLTVDAEGETDAFEWRAADDPMAEQSVHQGGNARSSFSLDYLKDIADAPPAGTRVRIELGEEYPLGLAYDIADGAGHVRFMLAPRIQG